MKIDRAQYYFLLVLNALAGAGYKVVSPFWEGEVILSDIANSLQKCLEPIDQVLSGNKAPLTEYVIFVYPESIFRARPSCCSKKQKNLCMATTLSSTPILTAKASIFLREYGILFACNANRLLGCSGKTAMDDRVRKEIRSCQRRKTRQSSVFLVRAEKHFRAKLVRNIRVDLVSIPLPREMEFNYCARQHFRYKNETNQYMLQVCDFPETPI